MARHPVAEGDLAATLPERLAAARAADVASKVPYPIGLRHLRVLRSERLGAALLRITLGGPELAGFVSHVAEEPLRLVLPDDEGELRLPTRAGEVLRWPRPAVVSREYTLRRYDPDAGELDIEFVLHRGGRAATWAAGAAPGDGIHVAGPPGGFVVPEHHRRFLLAGDETALPQIARYLASFDPDVVGRAVVEVADHDAELPLVRPPGVELVWAHRDGAAPGTGNALERAVRRVDPTTAGRVFVWMAGEAGALRPLRRWVSRELGVPAGDTHVSGYWRRGVADYDDD